jgi:glycosyltransferase involved in cell wall biosynthesis
MFISVLVAVRNGERFLAEALQSISEQAISNLEVIVVDGGSTDRSVAVAQALPGISLINQQGEGLAAARNQGVQAARGELIAFLDADDVWARDKLQIQVAYLKAHPQCQIVIGHMIRFLQAGCSLPPAYKGTWLNRPTLAYTPGGTLVRRSVFSQVGGFNPAFGVGCDSDWFVRVRDLRAQTTVVPQVGLYKRVHEGNLSRDVGVYQREVFALLRQSLARRKVGGEWGSRGQ